MDYQSILNTIEQKLDKRNCKGKVAAYIPELAKVPADKLGMRRTTLVEKMRKYNIQREENCSSDN